MTPLSRGYLALLAGMIALFLLIHTASAQGLTRTHACYDINDSITLSDHLASKQWVGYEDLYNTLEAEGKCLGVLMPLPAPPNHLYTAAGDGFLVTIHPLMGTSGIVFGLLFRGQHPTLSAS